MQKIIKDQNNKRTDKYLSLPIVLVTFKGQELPEEVSIFRVACSVEPYIQKVNQCRENMRFDNISDRNERCKKCGGEHFEQNCDEEANKCIHCRDNHYRTDSERSPQFAKQKCIMAYENISYRETQEKENTSYATVLRNYYIIIMI
ncbi:hypothetical protein HHI36_008629 [Cryptolaemus montrouzieri]|uniref:Uncharacterized protein n=1 Tax=Cryptolaemus montrouzieri TaxID=559131 RepID=A0ABD2MT43_9CUCU